MNSAASPAARAERAGALAIPAHDRPGASVLKLDASAAIAFAVAHVERAQLGARARRQEVAPLQAGELLAAQAGVAEHEHDRQVARAGERVVGGPRLRPAYQPRVLGGAERLGQLALGGLGAWQPDGQRLADLPGGHVVMLGQPAQEAVERRAVLLDGGAGAAAGDRGAW